MKVLHSTLMWPCGTPVCCHHLYIIKHFKTNAGHKISTVEIQRADFVSGKVSTELKKLSTVGLSMCAVHHNVLFNFVNTSEVFLVVVFF